MQFHYKIWTLDLWYFWSYFMAVGLGDVVTVDKIMNSFSKESGFQVV